MAGPYTLSMTGKILEAKPLTHSRLRRDIEGLRAVAVGLVLLYHAGIAVVPGGFVGVDVFFVVSGFLITGTLIREIEKTGRVSLASFYARRIRRLLPASFPVLVFSLFLAVRVLPSVSTRDFSLDIAAAAGYFVNWRFAARAVDYLAEDVGASPVQHFWSLSVEEQFYVIWPLLIIMLLALIRRYEWDVRRALIGGLTLVAVPSLLWSIEFTSRNPQYAFFDATTRIWELSLGAFVAVGAVWLPSLPARLRWMLGWAGLVAIGVSGVMFDQTSAWPGYLALVPTVGTVGVIVAGLSGGDDLG